MKILVLDDSEYRHAAFAKKFDGEDVLHVRTYTECIAALASDVWDVVYLDHDLGDFLEDGRVGDTYRDGRGIFRQYTGYDVAKRICEMDNGLRPGRVVVHSANSSGGQAIEQILTRQRVPTTREPFSYIPVEEES